MEAIHLQMVQLETCTHQPLRQTPVTRAYGSSSASGAPVSNIPFLSLDVINLTLEATLAQILQSGLCHNKRFQSGTWYTL
jgi:hypothetical protein